jgi:hypothetical protein
MDKPPAYETLSEPKVTLVHLIVLVFLLSTMYYFFFESSSSNECFHQGSNSCSRKMINDAIYDYRATKKQTKPN